LHTPLIAVARALLEVVLPARCHRCDGPVAQGASWGAVPGLRWCDVPQLCLTCRRSLLDPRPATATLAHAGLSLRAAAGRPTDQPLAEIVADWKYRGCRSLALPLAELADAAWDTAVSAGGAVDALVPIPLHRRRLRERGFNQAALLAALIAARRRVPVRADLLRRRRATAQQAKLASRSSARARNVAGAFAGPRRDEAADLRVGLVDDLVTSGATALAAAACLADAGVRVRWVLAAGLSRRA